VITEWSEDLLPENSYPTRLGSSTTMANEKLNVILYFISWCQFFILI
jgi:hypothetical protein